MEVVKVILAVVATPFVVVGLCYLAGVLVPCLVVWLKQLLYLCPFILVFTIIIDGFQIKVPDTVSVGLWIGLIIVSVIMAIYEAVNSW